jgi:hypothetical protein
MTHRMQTITQIRLFMYPLVDQTQSYLRYSLHSMSHVNSFLLLILL